MRHSPEAIHQFHASVAWGDAIGNYLLALRSLLRHWGYGSEIFRVHAQAEVAQDTYPVDGYLAWSSPANLLLVHYSIGWESWPEFLNLPDKKILIYHNITPAEFFEHTNQNTASMCRKGRADLPRLAPYFSAAIADSEFNAIELREAGFQDVEVIPPLIDFAQYAGPRDGPQPTDVSPKTVNWLFVSRVSPNKKQEDLIRAFAYYQRYIRRESQLLLVGPDEGMETYTDRLHQLVKELRVANVNFVGKVPFNELLTFYQRATVFVCLSEHEGFCIPLLEAMRLGIPIVAYAQAAVEETLQDSGLVLREKSPNLVAEAVELVMDDSALRKRIIEKQYQRLKEFEYDKVRLRIEAFLQRFGAQPRRRRRSKKRIQLACATLRYSPHIGGTETVLQNVLERLVKDNFSCTVYATDAKSVEDIFSSSQGNETEEWINDVRVIRSPITNPPKKAWLARNLDRLTIYGHGAWSYRQFRHLLEDRYDILHSSPFPSTHNYLAYLAARLRRKPFACSPHLHIADAYHSDRRSLFALMRGAAAVMTLTSCEREFCIRRGVPPSHIYVTGVGIDPALAQDDLRLPEPARNLPGFAEAKKFVFVGRKDPKKGIVDILNALRLLHLRHPEVLLICVGPETSYSKSLWERVPKSLQPHLLVLDPVSESEKRALITNSEALILMSTTESFGIVFLEAWLHGKPVIGARAGAIQAVVEDGMDGLLVEPGNYVELAAAMQFLLENPEIGAALGAKGRANTLKQYTWDRVAEEWARILWQISN